jgi:chaperonin GroES
MNIRPMFDKIIVEVDEVKETELPSGIILPPKQLEDLQEGRVIAFGPGRRLKGKHRPIPLKIGDKILFDKWSVAELIVDEKKVYMMIEDSVIGVIDGAA